MHDDPRFAEVGARLEEAVKALPGEAASPAELYDRYEMVAIAILDSEHMDFEYSTLDDYLRGLLQEKRHELDLDATD